MFVQAKQGFHIPKEYDITKYRCGLATIADAKTDDEEQRHPIGWPCDVRLGGNPRRRNRASHDRIADVVILPFEFNIERPSRVLILIEKQVFGNSCHITPLMTKH